MQKYSTRTLLRFRNASFQDYKHRLSVCCPFLKAQNPLLLLSQGLAPFAHPLPSTHSSGSKPGVGRGVCTPPHSSLSQKDGAAPCSSRSQDLSVTTAPRPRPTAGSGAPHPRTPWGHRRPARAPRLGYDLAGALANHIWNVFQLQEQ